MSFFAVKYILCAIFCTLSDYSIIREFKVCKNIAEMIGDKNENVLLYLAQTYIFSVER